MSSNIDDRIRRLEAANLEETKQDAKRLADENKHQSKIAANNAEIARLKRAREEQRFNQAVAESKRLADENREAVNMLTEAIRKHDIDACIPALENVKATFNQLKDHNFSYIEPGDNGTYQKMSWGISPENALFSGLMGSPNHQETRIRQAIIWFFTNQSISISQGFDPERLTERAMHEEFRRHSGYPSF